MFGTFPSEAEPDGAVFGPHHFYLGVLLILLICWMVYADADERGPWVVAGATLFSVFAFALTWPYYPEVGAVGVLFLLGVATLLATVRPLWWRYGLLMRSGLFLGLFVAWDDALSHAFGWRTPLDALWARYLYPYASDPYVPSDLRLPSEVRLPPDLKAFLAEQIRGALAMVAL